MRLVLTYFTLFYFLQVHCQLTQLNSGTTVDLRNLSVINKNIVIGGLTNNYIRKSYNECSQLISMNCPGPSGNYNYLQRLDSNTLFFLSYANGAMLYKSTDGGLNWVKKMDTTIFAPSCFGFFDSLEGITDKGLGGNLLRTVNGGNSWTNSTMPLDAIEVIKIFGDSTVIIGGSAYPSPGGAFFISKNRGNSWAYAGGYGGIYSFPTDFFFLNKDTIFSISSPGNDGSFFAKSTDGGTNFQGSNIPLYYPNGISFKKANEGYVIGADLNGIGTILRTSDLGQSWQSYSTGVSTRLLNIAFLNDSIALLTGTKGVILRWNFRKSVFTGISENYVDNIGLKIFPNPVKDKLHFESDNIISGDIKITINNALGQVVYSRQKSNLKDELDISFLNPGIYNLMIQGVEGRKVFKILKE